MSVQTAENLQTLLGRSGFTADALQRAVRQDRRLVFAGQNFGTAIHVDFAAIAEDLVFLDCEFQEAFEIVGNSRLAYLTLRGCSFRRPVRIAGSFNRLEAWRCIFHGTADFSDAYVTASGDRPDDAYHDGETNFSFSYFLAKALFSRSEFRGETWFYGTRFLSDVDLLGAKFGNPTHFVQTHLISICRSDFLRVYYGQWRDFPGGASAPTDSLGQTKNIELLFRRLLVKGITVPSGEGPQDPSRVSVAQYPQEGAGDFWKERLAEFPEEEQALFRTTVAVLSQPMFSRNTRVAFEGATFSEQPDNPHFEKCDLSRCFFSPSALKVLNCSGVTWSSAKLLFSHRVACAGEGTAHTPGEFRALMQSYAALKANYERRDDQVLAFQFQVAEHEMACRAGEWWRWLRRLFDEHGTNPALLFFWILVVNAGIFPLSYWLLGVTKTFWGGVSYGLEVMILAATEHKLPESAISAHGALLAAQAAIAVGMATMFFFGIKRRLNTH